MLKWAGSKAWLVPAIGRVDECVELFAGSAKVSFSCADACHLNDLCEPLMNVYRRLVQDGSAAPLTAEVLSLFGSIQTARRPSARYYSIRQRFNKNGQTDPVEFLVLLYSGFNGLWRVGPSGNNVPYGNPRGISVDFLEDIPISKIRSVSSVPWQEFSIPNTTCLVYVDPPYTGTHTSYTNRGWTSIQDNELVRTLSKLPNPVLLSCRRTKELESLLAQCGFDFVAVPRTYAIGRTGKKSEELLAFNDLGRQYVLFKNLRTGVPHVSNGAK